MTEQDMKLAEDTIRNWIQDENLPRHRMILGTDEICELMQAYHEAKMKEVTDEDIELYARRNSLSEVTERGMIEGAKAMTDREIKFRGLSLIVGVHGWKYGYFSVGPEGAYITTPKGDIWPVAIKSIGQYIGLQDVSDKEIYTGDIVKFDERPSSIGEVIFDNACFIAKMRMSGIYWKLSYKSTTKRNRVTIIGNVSENPELLTGPLNK
jgi:hypothetical protein